MRKQTIRPEFVESAPKQLSDGILYISERFRTALHKCSCGCGKEVVTPLSPAGWSYYLENGKVTLKPSIGNWSFPCKSHYMIIRNQVVWASTMSDRQIAKVKARDVRDQESYIAHCNQTKSTVTVPIHHTPKPLEPSWFSKFKSDVRRWLGS